MPATTVASPGSVPSRRERFTLLEVLGRGGMGDVHRAWDHELEIEVALKSLRPDAARDPKVLASFKREIKLARRIKHVNVAQVHDLVEVGGERYLSMEYVDGKTIAAILKAKRALPLRVALAVLRQACSGVQAAHDVGVVHRDLKPLNMMIRRRGGRLAILDFGIAREAGSAEDMESGVILGSPQYMSYEQLAGRPATARSDVYSLGILLYEMTTGVSPFRVPGTNTAALRALREIPPDPRQHEPRLPAFVAEATLKALDRSPERRFDSALALMEALDEHRDALPGPSHEEAHVETDSGPLRIAEPPAVLVALPAGPQRDDIAGRLTRLGFAVTTVADGMEAVNRSFEARYQVAIVGALLPTMDGLTACQLMKRSPGGADTKIVVVLEGSDPGREAFARQVGATEVLHAPLNVHAFSRTLREMLGH